MYQNGELDIIDLEALDSSIVEATYKAQYADKLVVSSRVGLTYFALNENNQYLSDVNVRKALQMAVDADTIVSSIYAGNAMVENGIFLRASGALTKISHVPLTIPKVRRHFLPMQATPRRDKFRAFHGLLRLQQSSARLSGRAAEPAVDRYQCWDKKL